MNWKTPITLLVLLGLLLGAAFFGWQTIVSPDKAGKTPAASVPKPRCERKTTFKKGQTIRAEEVVVNVYNAGDISGLAGNTLSALVGKGFKGGLSDNAPGSQTAQNVTILTRDPKSPKVKLVRLQFRGPVRVVSGELAAGIDVVVGAEFRSVNANAATTIRLKHAVTSCTKPKN